MWNGCGGTVRIEYTLARMGAERLWHLLHTEAYVAALGALTGNQAVQQVQAGLKAIYLSGWQVAGDANLGGQMYPDQSLYPANSVPAVVRAINNALQRADQIHRAEGMNGPVLVCPDRGGCGGRLRRSAECFRTDEGDDRGGRGGGALRRPALLGEEVRAYGRQGGGADLRIRAEADRRAPGGGRAGGSDCAGGPHGRQ